MAKFHLFSVVALCIAAYSCGHNPSKQHIALSNAGSNAAEIKKVLNSFQGDSVRRKAAEYIVENMYGKTTLDSASVSGNNIFFESLIEYRSKHSGDYGPTGLYDICDSLLKCYGRPSIRPTYTSDLKTVSSDILIRHIGLLVSIWETSPWYGEVSFDDFCKYVLPYQAQPNWWPGATEYLRSQYADSMTIWSANGRLAAALKLKSAIEASFHQDGTFFRDYSFMGTTRFENTVKAQTGVCNDFNSTLVTALRAFGIPAVLNTIPYWGNSNAKHFWTEIIGMPSKGIYDNSQLDFHTVDEEIVNDTFWFKDFVLTDTTGIPPYVRLRKTRTVPKIYRLGFEINEQSPASTSKEELPSFFQDPTLEDITASYVMTGDVRIPIDRKHRNRTGYLCCYEPNSVSWTPVAWGEADTDDILFKDMGVNVVYIAAFFIRGRIVPFSDPFLLLPSGEIQFFTPDDSANDTATLLSKVPLRTHFAFYASTMKGDKIRI